ncbi:MAG: ABC transporter permease subunit, partial [Clostridiales bacterium]|nr:ABC transporter permease subunit [Clostridiales bacterium]
WELRDLSENITRMKVDASTKSDDLTIEFLQIMMDNSLVIASEIDTHEDFRNELSWLRMQVVIDRFVFENLDKPKEDIRNAMQYRMGIDLLEIEKKYYSLDQIEVLQKMQEIEDKLTRIDKMIIDNDYIEFYLFKLETLEEGYLSNLEKIKVLEKDILENPENEMMYSEQIESYKKANVGLQEIEKLAYEYRIEHDIAPRSGDWRDVAVGTKTNAQNQLLYDTMSSEEQFEANDHLKREHKTYSTYKKFWQKQQDELTKKIYIAERSLDSMKPDMEYVVDGARKNVVTFLSYSMLIAIFGVIIGGGLIAREFQSGTVRLLLIRPKSRVKILLSKFLALIAICFALYIASAILNMIANGIVFGFNDFAYPNYTISSGVNGIGFFSFFAPKFLICFITVFFACATAYFLSVSTKNTALSVAIPLVLFVGSLIIMQYVMYNPQYSWLIYTPLPYINLASFYTVDSMYTMYNKVQPNLAIGLPMIIVLSFAFIVIGTYIGKKRDIAN